MQAFYQGGHYFFSCTRYVGTDLFHNCFLFPTRHAETRNMSFDIQVRLVLMVACACCVSSQQPAYNSNVATLRLSAGRVWRGECKLYPKVCYSIYFWWYALAVNLERFFFCFSKNKTQEACASTFIVYHCWCSCNGKYKLRTPIISLQS